MMGVCKKPQIKQTKKQAYFTKEFFQDWTLELSHLYEFSSAGFVMREKRLRRKVGVIDMDRMMGFMQETNPRSNKQRNKHTLP